ncbi:hypothetical protein [Neotabrizicola shimadae]|uniref:Uncharacterized protein n=1 Tax=Neotabrizicola shimadae TaxID=2807096 RepID=A0A8G0ZUQ8_9RHOB|nr:hypothetical protein [Neotabrizicola shimadae]QYZ70834.1 hypothetical protein JO391_04780 [Neotabrizicola shimadae]
MPVRPSSPLFLARASYRRRRLIDAARLLPLAGAFLFLLPVLWAPSDLPAGVGRDTAMDGLYLFAAWALLILAAALMAPGLSADPPQDDPDAGQRPLPQDER